MPVYYKPCVICRTQFREGGQYCRRCKGKIQRTKELRQMAASMRKCPDMSSTGNDEVDLAIQQCLSLTERTNIFRRKDIVRKPWRALYPQLSESVDYAIANCDNEYVVRFLSTMDAAYALDGETGLDNTIRIVRPNLKSWASCPARVYLEAWKPGVGLVENPEVEASVPEAMPGEPETKNLDSDSGIKILESVQASLES